MKTTLIACCDSMGGIGKDGGIPWYLSSDLKHFSEYTKGKPCVMGRKTWNSLPLRPLPERENIIITSTGWKDLYTFYGNESVVIRTGTNAVSDVVEIGNEMAIKELIIMGGASIYEQFMPFATNIVLTNLSKHYHCDTFFPTVDYTKWKCTAIKELEPGVNVNYWERKGKLIIP